MKNHNDVSASPAGQPAPAVTMDLSRHCIQTAVRRRYESRLAQYFRSGADRQALEGEIDMLRQALETVDFGALRTGWPALAGGRPVAAVLGRVKETIVIVLEETVIEVPLKTGRDRSPVPRDTGPGR